MKFDVWAPYAHDVKLVVDDEEHQMRRDDKRRGWWLSDIEKTPGQCYGFSLYDGESWTAPVSYTHLTLPTTPYV